jgi:hypothetical protein
MRYMAQLAELHCYGLVLCWSLNYMVRTTQYVTANFEKEVDTF